MDSVIKIIDYIKGKRLNLSDEKSLQNELHTILAECLPGHIINKEFRLDGNNIPDFMIDGELAIEVKIKGSKRSIYAQCARYCSFDAVKYLLLISNIPMGFPKKINNKDCYYFNLSKAWL